MDANERKHNNKLLIIIEGNPRTEGAEPNPSERKGGINEDNPTGTRVLF